ncbi:MAG: regulatory protein RecX [Armatimonadota bacterium]|nr:regulatory protein RecX [Armatimonadota bacterium]
MATQAARALGLAAGSTVDAATFARMVEAAERQQARAVALRLLQRRWRSRRELEVALRRRGLPGGAIASAVGELLRHGWIDDERFARAWVQDRLALRPCGRRRLRAELLAKGIAPGLVDAVVSALLPAGVEGDLALVGARARLARLRGLSPQTARRRLVGWLQRRGFSAEVVARVLRTLELETPDQPDVDPAA